MKYLIFTFFIALIVSSCSSSKTYFTSSVRSQVERGSIPVTKLQFYVDRDVELRREVASSNTHVSAGVIKFENGKFVNIITLKRNTPGVCTNTYNDKIDVSFEVGEGRYLTFGKLQRNYNAPYTLYANSWQNNLGEIVYDGQRYFILPGGSEARLMIKKSVLQTVKVDKREMNGRKVQ
jgi:hypothetical protein